MSQWNVKAPTLFILGCVTFLMLLIVVLPDVDLPDTAFHRGTAPVLIHTQATAPPAAVKIASVFQLPHAAETSWHSYESKEASGSPYPNFRPFLLCSIRW